MSVAVDHIPTLVGVIVGAVGSYLVSAFGERTKWRRTLQVRWDERRVTVYSEYGMALKSLFNVIVEILYLPKAEPARLEQLRTEMTLADRRRAERWETVLLLGAPEAVSAGREWHRTIWRLMDITGDKTSSWSVVVQRLEESAAARLKFYLSVRIDLGLQYAALPDEPAVVDVFANFTEENASARP